MSLNLGTLFLTVRVAGHQNIGNVTGALQGLEKTAVRAGASLAALYATTQAVRQTIQLADGYTEFSNSIRIATDSLSEYRDVQAQVTEIARSTASELDATGLLYRRLESGTSDLGISQERLLRIVETTNKAVALGGSNAAEASGAIRQFSQAIGNDFKASSQEMNSILEQTPGLAKAIAQGLGVSTSELKKMAKDQVLSSEMVLRALEGQAESIDAMYANVAFSISKSWEKGMTGASAFIGRLNELTGAGRSFANTMDDISKQLADPAFAEEVLTKVVVLKNSFEEFFNILNSDTGGFAADFKRNFNELFDIDVTAQLDEFAHFPVAVATFAKIAGVEIADFSSKLIADIDYVGKTIYELLSYPFNMIVGVVNASWALILNSIAYLVDQARDKLSFLLPDDLENQLKGVSEGIKSIAEGMDERANQEIANPYEEILKHYEDHVNKKKQLDQVRIESLEQILAKHEEIKQKINEESAQEVDNMKKAADAALGFDEDKANFIMDQTKGFFANMNKIIADASKAQKEQQEKDMKEFAGVMEQTLGSELKNLLTGNFDDIGKAFGNMIQNMIIEAMAADIMGAIGLGDFATGGGSLKGGMSWLGGFFAEGGNPPIGKASVVGENGPELIVPRGSMTVIPNDQMGGNTINISMPIMGDADSGTIKKTVDQATRELKSRLARV